MRRTMVLGHVIGPEVGRLASFREPKALFILARQTTARIVHVIKHAKLQRLHRVPTHFRELANLPEPQDASGRARVLLPHFACNLITESGAWALIGYNGNSFHVATNNERGQRIAPACKERENRHGSGVHGAAMPPQRSG